MRAQTYHWLDSECHTRLRCANCLVLRIMGNIGSRMEELVDSVPAIRRYDTAFLALRMSRDDVSRILESHARLDNLYCLI